MSHLVVVVLLLVDLVSLLPYSASPFSFKFTKFDQVVRLDSCSQGINKICLEGAANVSADFAIDLTSKHVQNQLQFDVGLAVYSEPIKLWDNTGDGIVVGNFTTQFAFNITKVFHGESYANGMAFFLFPNPFQGTSQWNGGCLGLVYRDGPAPATCNSTSNHLAAVEFDTFQNNWDPPAPHVGINVNGIKSVENISLNASDGLHFCAATVSYSSVDKKLSVSLDYNDGGHVDLSYVVDLSKVLPKSVIVGFSGSTGNLTELNRLISWSFYSSLDDRSKSKHDRTVVAIAVPVALLLLVVLGFLIWFFSRKICAVNEVEGMIDSVVLFQP